MQRDDSTRPEEIKEMLIEFAKLHVKAALEAAADTTDPRTNEERDFDDCDIILNAYPENLIV